MKRFEHEVLTFSVAKPKEKASMKATLSEWGAAGWEIVSVVPSDMHSYSLTVFLKRELNEITNTDDEVA